jgi:hypothetical protein
MPRAASMPLNRANALFDVLGPGGGASADAAAE